MGLSNSHTPNAIPKVRLQGVIRLELNVENDLIGSLPRSLIRLFLLGSLQYLY
jgi:hypothetical protein